MVYIIHNLCSSVGYHLILQNPKVFFIYVIGCFICYQSYAYTCIIAEHIYNLFSGPRGIF